MATTTLDVMFPELAREFGAWGGSFSTTTNVAANTSVISTGLAGFGYFRNDHLIDWYIRFTSGNNDDAIRHISDYDATASAPTITVSGAALSAESGSTTFEIYRFDPNRLLNYLNDGRLSVYPSLHLEVNDRTTTASTGQTRYPRPTSIVPGGVKQVYAEPRVESKTAQNNILGTLDCDFEGALTDWATSNITLTAEEETTGPDNFVVFLGGQSGKMVVGASSVGTALLTVPSGSNYVGQELNLSVWVYCKTASRVSAAIFEGGSSVATSSTHAGSGWERLSVSRVIAQGVSAVTVGVSVTSGAAITIWADEAIAVAGPSEGPRRISQPILRWYEEGDNIVIEDPLPTDGQVLVRGLGYLSSVSAGSDTVEVDANHRKLLYKFAKRELYSAEVDTLDNDTQLAALRRFTHARNESERLEGYMSPMPLMRSEVA